MIINKYKTENYLYYFLFIILASGPIINKFLPISIFGTSFFITVLPFLITLLLYFTNIIKTKFVLYFFILTIIALFILLQRYIFYDEDFFSNFITNIFIIYIPIFLLLFRQRFYDYNFKKIIIRIIKIIFYLYVLNTFLFIYGFPNFNFGTTDLNVDQDLTRFRGILGGSNANANFICSLFLIIIFVDNKFKLFNFIIYLALCIIGILPSLSRGAMLITILITLYFLITYFINAKWYIKIYTPLILFITFLLFYFYWANDYIDLFIYNFSERIFDTDDNGGRLDRIFFTFNQLNKNWYNNFLGIPVIDQTSINNHDLNVSDNSFLLLIADFGIIYSIAFILFIIQILNLKKNQSLKSLFYFIIVFLIFLLNNAFLYFQLCAFTFLGYFLLKTNNINDKNTHNFS